MVSLCIFLFFFIFQPLSEGHVLLLYFGKGHILGMTIGCLSSLFPYSLQNECSPSMWDQRGSQLWSGRQRNCQSAGWPWSYSRQDHQQRPEEEKGREHWFTDSGAFSGPAPKSTLEWGCQIPRFRLQIVIILCVCGQNKDASSMEVSSYLTTGERGGGDRASLELCVG